MSLLIKWSEPLSSLQRRIFGSNQQIRMVGEIHRLEPVYRGIKEKPGCTHYPYELSGMQHGKCAGVGTVSFGEDRIPEEVGFWGAPEREEFNVSADPGGSLW